MSDNKDEILADFQSITAIDDVGEAFSCLEESNWDLMVAVRRYMPPEVSGTASAIESVRNYERYDKKGSLYPGFRYSGSGPSTSSSINSDVSNLSFSFEMNQAAKKEGKEAKMLTFNIHFNRQVYTITIRSSATVEDLKDKIHSLTKVPICRQAIRGWPPAKLREAQNSHTLLENLDLATENELILIDLTEEGYIDDESVNEINKRFGQTFTLNIVQQPEGKTMSLEFPGTKTILDVKTDVYSITDIPVRHQEWSGWPNGSDNSVTLAESAIQISHNLVLRSNADKIKNNSKSGRNSTVTKVESDSSADEFEDASDFNADDDIFSDSPAQPRLKHLIPDQIDDETIGSIQFVENYVQRYGEPHPVFFQGSLDDAIKEACHKPAKERKLLAIYLHHDQSVLTNVFCDQLLRCESVMQTLIQNFILYGWDFTHESNKNLFLSSISVSVGITVSMTIRNIPVDRLPAIIIIAKNRSACEILTVIHGNVGVDDLLSRLMETVDIYSERIKVEIKEENERALRAQVKFEQDMAYQQTLEADRAKEAAKKQKELAIAAEKERVESEKAQIKAVKEANRQEAERSLPQMPDLNETDITTVRLRMLDGNLLERRFFLHNKIKDLHNFVTSMGFPIDEFKIISLWPRRDLTQTDLDPEKTFKDLGFCHQESLLLEER